MYIKKNQRICFSLTLIAIVVLGCSKDGISVNENAVFTLCSDAISTDSLLSEKYTCDGESSTLPLKWENPPDNAVTYTLIMNHHSPDGIHCYWILYNIPASVTDLPENVSNIGELGINTVNENNEYAPPCSQGLGKKAYIYTLYALSEELEITVAPSQIDYEFIIGQIESKTISSTSMTVYYSRQIN